MPISPYIAELRTRVGHDLLLLPAVTAVIRNGGRFLLARELTQRGQELEPVLRALAQSDSRAPLPEDGAAELSVDALLFALRATRNPGVDHRNPTVTTTHREMARNGEKQ
ncbi:hypothetical protein SAMN04487846_0009 [Microbacterium sp. cf046]|uniref:hypothetical protein n=1 Tax=Microbacterium sp. cf046 TaxID=1761803 RepID=UPI0008EBE1F2|nr:hypothetical protein [Microbacterium sp. cf046]SFR85688.1 hypothetical protein SAMN04487846_0009 [Microbacterium sp. cf046]